MQVWSGAESVGGAHGHRDEQRDDDHGEHGDRHGRVAVLGPVVLVRTSGPLDLVAQPVVVLAHVRSSGVVGLLNEYPGSGSRHREGPHALAVRVIRWPTSPSVRRALLTPPRWR